MLLLASIILIFNGYDLYADRPTIKSFDDAFDHFNLYTENPEHRSVGGISCYSILDHCTCVTLKLQNQNSPA